jgi:FdhE protein
MKKNKDVLSVLYGRKELSDSYVSFRIALSEITGKYQEVYKAPEIVFPAEETIRSQFADGCPLVTFIPVSLSLKALTSCFREIIAAFQAHKICTRQCSSWVKKQADYGFLKAITGAVFSFDFDVIQELAEPTPFDGPTLILAGRELVKPFFHHLANRAAGAVSFDHWSEGNCPICGDKPDFARLSSKEEGKRCLWCSTCDLEWGFQRVCCPFCKNSDHKKLRFLTTDFREELRIDVCEKCKGYIKTIDERKTGNKEAAIFLKENVASVYLDLLAEEKGYVKLLPTFRDVKPLFHEEQAKK